VHFKVNAVTGGKHWKKEIKQIMGIIISIDDIIFLCFHW
jgi:hypothetical protein